MAGTPRAGITTARAATILAIAGIAAYANVLEAPFVFDDIPSIEQNESIRDLRDLGRVLRPPAEEGTGVAGRPLVNVTLAVNYAAGGLDPRGYHLFNLVIHVLAACALFGLVRRILQGPVLGPRLADRAGLVALGTALLWTVHPLQTETVTCVVQRTEGIVGLCYLLTLYAFVRATERPAPARNPWAWAATAACFAGMASKEVMVTAPVLALLLDRTFFAGTFAAAWRARRELHAALALGWLLLLHLLTGNPMRGGTAGFTGDISLGENLLTQSHALALYLKLTLWPDPLVLDYGSVVIRDPRDVLGAGCLVLALLGATIWALWRRPAWGFLGAWFFVILSPSSSVIPLITQTIAEHRMYLPLAAPLAGVAAWLLRRPGALGPAVAATAAAVLLSVTILRNADYRTAESIWTVNARHRPDNPRSFLNLAELAERAGRPADAVPHYRAALALQPEHPTARFKLAFALAATGRTEEALGEYAAAVRQEPAAADVRINYAAALLAAGRIGDAIEQYEAALQLAGPAPEIHFNLGLACLRGGRLSDALSHFGEAVRLRPDDPAARFAHGQALARAQRFEAAAGEFRRAAQLQPDHAEAWANLGAALFLGGDRDGAIAAYAAAVRLRPEDPRFRERLEHIRSSGGP
ncbi:MAG TPA: tetratricopeptide repeat protein [Opitutaceae bacterium]|nr:tetratricopeptide repeat protein [Opitutaceae bacterium]